jgi:prevent-host-death family protein
MEMIMGKVWKLQDAKNKFSAVVEAAQRGEPQHVTKRGVDAVVVVSAEELSGSLGCRVSPRRHSPSIFWIFPAA